MKYSLTVIATESEGFQSSGPETASVELESAETNSVDGGAGVSGVSSSSEL